MRFTFWAIGAPLAGVALFLLLSQLGFDARSSATLAGACGIWLMIGFPLATIYWIVRIVRRAWREGTPAAPAEPESGRIFGRL